MLLLNGVVSYGNGMMKGGKRMIKDRGELFMKLKELSKENNQLEEDLDYYKAKCASLETGMFNLEREYDKLKKENQAIQDKVFKLLDWLEKEKEVNREEIKEWWND